MFLKIGLKFTCFPTDDKFIQMHAVFSLDVHIEIPKNRALEKWFFYLNKHHCEKNCFKIVAVSIF